MDRLNRAIVIYDLNQKSQPAVVRAIQLAKTFSLDLLIIAVVFDSTYEVYSLLDNSQHETLKQNLIQTTENNLRDICEGIEKQGINCQQKVIWGRRADEIISELSAKDNTEIVIKGTRPHSTFKSIFFTPIDWNLLRHCPTPVLLVKQKDWFKRGVILVAVDSTSGDPSHQELNRNLLNHAKNIAKATDKLVHVINVYPVPILEVPVEFSAVNYVELQQQSKEFHQRQTRELLIDFDIPQSQQHVVAGLPEEMIAEKVEQLDAHLLIIGTVGRSGLTAAVIGNTAEHTVDKVSCDVLALKPQQYIDFLRKK